MEDENKKDNIVPVCLNYYGDNFDEDDKDFMSKYNNLSENCFDDLYINYGEKPAVVYTIISDKRTIELSSDFDYKSTFAEILFSKKSKLDDIRLFLLYNVFCWNVLYQKMLADELSKQRTNKANNFSKEKRQELGKLKSEIKNTAFYQNLFDELVYHLVEFKNDEDVIKFLWEKTFGSSDDGKNKDKFVQMEKEILDCVKQVNEKKHPIICIANADNVDVAKNKDKYEKYTFARWKKWDELPKFEKAYEKKLPDKKFSDVLSVGDGKIFGAKGIKSIKSDKPQETKKLLSQNIDDYLDEKDNEYENFFVLIDYYLDFCSRKSDWNVYSANNKLFWKKQTYLRYLISNHLKVIFQNGKRDDFMNKFNDKFIKKGYIENENEAEKAAIVNIIELSSTVQYGRIMTYDGDRYKLNNNNIYRNLLDNSQSDCLDCLGGDLFPKHWVDLIKNELEYKNLCKEIIFKKDTSALDAKDLSLIFEVFLFNVLYKKISNINLAKDDNEIREDLQNIWDEKIENSILNQGLFEKFGRNIVNFKDKDDVIKFLYKETFYVIGEVADDNKIFYTMKNEILDCVKDLKDNKAPLVFFTDNKFVKEKYSSDKYKSCHIFLWERKDNLPELREKTTMSLKENIKDVLCAFDDYIFGDINSQKDKNDIELPIKNKTEEDIIVKEQGDKFVLYNVPDKNIFVENNIYAAENDKMDYLLLFESIGDYLNEDNFSFGNETAYDDKNDNNDNISPEEQVNNNLLDLLEYYFSFCARKKELPAENKDYARHRLFNTKEKYLFGYIKNKLRIIRDNNNNNNVAEDFMMKFNSKFIENHKIKANKEAEKREIADFIDLLNTYELYSQDKSYFVIFDEKIYPTSIKYIEIIQNLDVFFDIDLDKCAVKLKDEEFRSAIYNVLNKSREIDRTELFKNFYDRVMQDENLSPKQKQERLNKIMPQLLKFISVYGLLDKTGLDHDKKDFICYCLDFDRFNELTDWEKPVDEYVQKLWVDISYGNVNYFDNNWNTDYMKILGVIKKMIDDKQLTLHKDEDERNVQVIQLLIKKFLLVDESFANDLKKKYLQAFFEKTDVNDITQSNGFKRLTLAFEIVSRLVGDNKEDQEHKVKQFFDNEIKKLFGLDGLQNSLLGFIDPTVELKAIKFCLNEDKNKDDIINKFVDSFKDAIEATKTSGNFSSIEKVFTETKPDFNSALSICERMFDEIIVYRYKKEYHYYDNGFDYNRQYLIHVLDLLLSLLSNDDFKLDSKEKQKRVYILYSKIISYCKEDDAKEKIQKLKDQIQKLKDQIEIKIYDKSKFNLVKYYYGESVLSSYYDRDNFEKRGDEIAIVDKPLRSKEPYLFIDTLLTELFKFKHWPDIVNSDKNFFANFIDEIVFHIESQDYKGSENDKNEFYGIYNIKSLAGYKSFQNDSLYFGQLSRFDKQKQREFIFDTDLFLKIRNRWLDACLNANDSLYKFLFQSNFTFVLPIDEITADKVNSAFQSYSQKLNENFKDKEGDKDKDGKYQKLKDGFFGLFAKSLIGHCELILSDEQYRKDKNQGELKNDYIKTIATFCLDREAKIIRSVLENCTRTAEEQKNKFIKPYAIIEALLNDENFKLDADKAKLMINWFSKYNVDELGIELKEYDNLKAIINKLYNKLKSDEVNLDDDDLIQLGKDMINCYELILMHSKDGNQRDELKDGYIKTIATFCCDKEAKIIRSVLKNCTRTAEEQKNKFIKPYAIIEALLNDDNFKLDADKAKLMINWFSKYNVDELGIELKEYDNLKAIINKLYNKLKSDEVNLDDDDLIQLGKDMINCYELILIHSKNINQRDELKDDYIKTIATFCRDKEAKIIRSVLENCTRTAEEQKNKFVKPYAIIEALLNDDNFKLDADKTALIIEWFIKHKVNALGIELKENETYDNLGVINKLFEKIENDSIELEQDKYTSLLRGKIRFMQVLPGEQGGYEVLRVNDVDSENSNEYKMIKSIAKKIFDRLEQQQKNINKIQVAQNNILATTNTNTVIAMNDNERISTAEKIFARLEQHQKNIKNVQAEYNNILETSNNADDIKVIHNHKKNSPLLKIIKWISFALITIAGLILILNSFIHMFSLSLVLSIPLILACIIFDMALFENGRKILKSILKCIFCRHTETNNYIGKNNYHENESSIFDNQNKITGNNDDIKLIESNQFEKNDN